MKKSATEAHRRKEGGVKAWRFLARMAGRGIMFGMARVLCINPWIYDFAAYNVWIEPLGLLTVAGALRAVGHEVALIDCLDRHHSAAPAPRSPHDVYGCGQFDKVEVKKPAVLAHAPRHWGRYGLPIQVFEAELAALPQPPDAVLVTLMMTYWYPGAFEVIGRVKARWPGAPLALGGVFATICTDYAQNRSGADVVLAGPGEVQAVTWLNEVTGEARALPLPPDEVLPAHDLRRPQGYVAVQTARGCPFKCPYCAVERLAPGGFAPRRPEQVVDEIAWCVGSLGARDVAFYDDALLVNVARHLYPILEGVLERGLQVRFHTPNGLHARFIDRPLARLMRRAGFATVRLGLETVNAEGLQRDGGKVDESSFGEAVEALFEAGFSAREVAAYVLIGRPGQCAEEVQATAAFAHRLGVPVRPAEFAPIPGTVEWRAAVEAGCLAADADPLLHNNSLYPCAEAQVWEAVKQRIREGNRVLLAR